MYQNFLKEGNGDHNFLRCPDIQDNNFEVLISAIALEKFNLECEENVKAKTTANYSFFIAYSNTINFIVNASR